MSGPSNKPPKPEQKTVVGRTPYDASVEISRMLISVLGRIAPLVVIVSMVVFGYYKFQELQRQKLDAINEARISALAENLETITELKAQIVSDAKSITELQSSNVEVILKQLNTQQSISSIVSDNMETISRLTVELSKSEVELAKKQERELELTESIEDAENRITRLENRSSQLSLTARVATDLLNVLSQGSTFVPSDDVWQIAERYEGGAPDFVGPDYNGVFYYGIYRIRGEREMDLFIDYSEHKYPFIGRALRSVNVSDGAKRGSYEFVRQWQRLAKRSEFAQLQRDYISENDYKSTIAKCKFIGQIDLLERSLALQSVMWAVTVQHGSSAAGTICKKVRDVFGETSDDHAVIEHIYDIRSERVEEYFPKQDPVIYRLMRLRYKLENEDANEILAAFDE